MSSQFERTEILLGKDSTSKLNNSHVAVFGVGGVGGFAVEALARAGIGTFTLIDKDVVSLSNINRQIIATHQTIGRSKVEVMKERIMSINPNASVFIYNTFFLPSNSSEFNFDNFDYVVDAVDTVSAKIEIIKKAKEANKPIISSMGAGNKLDPTGFKVADINQTSVCPLARAVRYELKKLGIKAVKVVYSKEEPILTEKVVDEDSNKVIPGSVSFIPSVCGLIIASEVIKDIVKNY